MTIELKPLQAITNAPVDYDYGWMKTVIDNIGVDDKGRPCRLVQNDDEWHFKQQLLRYSSGLHWGIDQQQTLFVFLKSGWLTLTPDKAVRVHRIKVNMEQAEDWDRQERLEFLSDVLQAMRTPGSPVTYETGHDMNYWFTARGDEAFEGLKVKLTELGLTWEPWGPQHEE